MLGLLWARWWKFPPQIFFKKKIYTLNMNEEKKIIWVQSSKKKKNCIYDRYIYRLTRVKHNHEIYRCHTKTCKGRIHIFDGKDVIPKHENNHESLADSEITACKVREEIRSVSSTLPMTPTD
ncbi:hypothetical protein NGRA_2460, partial [Nosema granulosis]